MAIDRRTKIVATLGPSSDSRERLRALIEAGVDAVRFNLSHGTHEDHSERAWLVREIAAEDRKSTRLNSSHPSISYAVFCLKKKRGRRWVLAGYAPRVPGVGM